MLSSSSVKSQPEIDFLYLAFLDQRLHPGVNKKIEQTISSFREAGLTARSVFVPPRPLFGSIARIIHEIITAKAKTVIIRSSARSLILIPALIIARLQKKKLILEVPTPIRVALNEVWSSRASLPKRLIIIFAQLAAFPLCFFFVDRILEYAEESKWFSFGNKKKIRLVANGIDVKSIELREQIPAWPVQRFSFIGVAAIAFWHGFDRVIRGIAKFKQQNLNSNNTPEIDFYIVGPKEGEEYKRLATLAKELHLEDQIHFLGSLEGHELSLAFERAHIAVGSIGLHRIGLKSASPLKFREYAARGVPFLASLEDPDFKPLPDFVFKVPADESPICTEDIIKFYESFAESNQRFLAIRKYAENKLDFKNKIEDFKI